jgi:DMSO/TMAO reductase YedYZ molybdopterin-dependent catalytic subunit
MGRDGADLAGRSSGLILRRHDPVNREVALSELTASVLVPTESFYVRDHFPEPELDARVWRLRVGGLVRRPLALSLEEIVEMAAQSSVVTLECAGNGRSMLTPRVEGEQWGLGAVSTAEWTGVPLAHILDRAGVDRRAREIVFRGADTGAPAGSRDVLRFERSLSVEDARAAGVLLATAMNGEPLSRQHGFPLRAIVPGWYAVASVKWLTEMELIGGAFTGYYQTHKYVYEWDRDGVMVTEPVRHQRVRSLIVSPATGEAIRAGTLKVTGLAWSGAAPIARVEVSLDRGAWHQATLIVPPQRYGWRPWEFVAELPERAEVSIRARANDELGQSQPEQPVWNRLGYGNNAVQEVVVRSEQ